LLKAFIGLPWPTNNAGSGLVISTPSCFVQKTLSQKRNVPSN
jgi:hypothetical protein